jgi:hypothetical protein
MICFPLRSDKVMIVYTAECQGCDVISALSVDNSNAAHGVQVGDTVKQT